MLKTGRVDTDGQHNNSARVLNRLEKDALCIHLAFLARHSMAQPSFLFSAKRGRPTT